MNVDKSVVPIFIKTKIPKQIVQIGTGIFVDIESEPFLFTAAHVTDDLKCGQLMVPTAEGLCEIEGYLAHIDLPPELSRNDDDVDMAYYRLSTRFAMSMCAHFFPLIRKAELVESSLGLNILSVVGFPTSKGKRRGREFTSELTTYRGVAASEAVYNQHELSAQQNIIVHFSKKHAVSPQNGNNVNMVSPKGVSGGAIFSWPRGHEFSDDWGLPRLVGILHSYKAKDGLFIGTTLLPYFAATRLGKMKGFGGVS